MKQTPPKPASTSASVTFTVQIGDRLDFFLPSGGEATGEVVDLCGVGVFVKIVDGDADGDHDAGDIIGVAWSDARFHMNDPAVTQKRTKKATTNK